MRNEEIARILRSISTYLEMKNEQIYRVRAYENAARSIESMGKQLDDIYKEDGVYGLMEIQGVGPSIAEKIEELLTTGKLKFYEELKKKAPVDVEGLTAIEGIGPKKVQMLYKKLKIRNVEDLEKAVRAGKIRKLERFGVKSEQDMLRGIEFLKKSGGRFLLGFVMPLIADIENRLKNLNGVEIAMVGGSVRRRKETVGDADFLVISRKPQVVMDYFTKMPEVVEIIGKGDTKSSVKLNNGMNVDVRVVPVKSFGAALQYFTGNKDHNIKLRNIAISKGYKLNEYGVFKGSKQINGSTEASVYEILGLKWMPPELRENTGEIEAAMKDKLPKLIDYGELKGDLQVQTNWTDGNSSIKDMAVAAKAYGLEYISITDHTKSLAMTHGLNERKLLQQKKEIEKINKQLKGITIFSGTEVNIMKDGSLDINDKTLAQLDVVGAAVHSNFNLSRQEQTMRIINAMENEHVDILFHPTGRVIKQREPYDVDIDKIIDVAKVTGTILEIDAYPDRLDLKDEYVKKAVNAGVKLSIDSDAHSKSHFRFLEFGVSQARRGWAEAKDVVNTKSMEEFSKFIKA